MSEDTPEVLPAVGPKTGGMRPAVRESRKIENRQARVLELAAKDVAPADIARATGLTHKGVTDIIKRYSNVFKALPKVADYRTIKADLLAAGQLTALESALSGAKLAKAGFLSTLQGFEILNKAERLETGKSTENIATQVRGNITLSNLTTNE